MTTARAIDRSGADAGKLFDGLQVAPWLPDDPSMLDMAGYRQKMMAYEVVEEVPAAFGITRANTGLGKGGLPQIFIPDFRKLVADGKIREVPEKQIPLENWHMNPDDINDMLTKIPMTKP